MLAFYSHTMYRKTWYEEGKEYRTANKFELIDWLDSKFCNVQLLASKLYFNYLDENLDTRLQPAMLTNYTVLKSLVTCCFM